MRLPTLVALVVLVATGCAPAPEDPMPAPPPKPQPSTATTTAAPGQVDPMLLRPQHALVGTFVPGIPLAQPGPALLAAIAAPELAGRRLLVPIQVDLVTGMVQRVRPGFADDAPVLPVDDSRLGIGLADRCRQRCGDRSPCGVWLVGRWEDTPLGGPRLVIGEVGDAIPSDEVSSLTHILVESRGP